MFLVKRYLKHTSFLCTLSFHTATYKFKHIFIYFSLLLTSMHAISLKLTRHDQQVLRKIIAHAKIPDTEIATSMGISPQAVFKIRQKLENLGIIKGYVPMIDYKKIGINVMVLLVIKVTSKVWDIYSDDKISERIREIPYVIDAYRISDSDVSHILLMGFRDTEQKDSFLGRIQTKFTREIMLQNVYTFSVDKIIMQNPLGLLYEILDKKEEILDELFIRKNNKKL